MLCGETLRTIKQAFITIKIRNLPGSTAENNVYDKKISIYSIIYFVTTSSYLLETTRSKFVELHQSFSEVFSPDFPGYNGALGPLNATVNMGPVQPPQRKGRLPQYSRNKLEELQQEFDRLEFLGVFKRPDEAGVVVEYLNPSFLVKKPSGGHRLVTSFSEIGTYSKPQPSLMPDIDTTLRNLARWKYLIATDLTSAFYQIPLDKASMKYCGVATPFRGIRVYTRSAMGMPGSETALEELMSTVLGDLIQQGTVVKIADDLYCGGDTPDELLQNWENILTALERCDLHLSPSKTIIAPKSTTVLGWKWQQGTLTATTHKLTALSSCDPPKTVKGLRSFIGAIKVLARVIPRCSNILSPLEEAVAGCQSNEQISWDETLTTHFNKAKQSLSSSQSIHLPRPDDQLWIVTDGAVKAHGLGATLYITRGESKPLLARFFSAKCLG